MPTLWLILGSLVLPFVWGWAIHLLLNAIWPESQQLTAARNENVHRPDPLADYQI